MKLRVVIPHYCGLSKQTVHGLEDLKAYGIAYDAFKVESTYIHTGRNVGIVGKEQSYSRPELPDFTHVLQLDSDIGFTAANVQMLIDRDMPIISGAYLSRTVPDCYTGGWYGAVEGKPVDGNIGEFVPHDTKGMVPVRWAGAGFMLIKRHVLEEIDFPWFCHIPVKYTDESGKDHTLYTGEDIGFCLRAEAKGFQVFMDCDCVVDHITNKQEAYGMAEAEQKSRSIESIIVEAKSSTKSLLRTAMRIEDTLDILGGVIGQLSNKVSALEAEIEASKGKPEEKPEA